MPSPPPPFPPDASFSSLLTPNIPRLEEQQTRNLRLYGLKVGDRDLPGKLMEIACEAFQELERQKLLWNLSGEAGAWWKNNKVRDEERLRVIRENALSKLSTEEQAVLKTFFTQKNEN